MNAREVCEALPPDWRALAVEGDVALAASIADLMDAALLHAADYEVDDVVDLQLLAAHVWDFLSGAREVHPPSAPLPVSVYAERLVVEGDGVASIEACDARFIVD